MPAWIVSLLGVIPGAGPVAAGIAAAFGFVVSPVGRYVALALVAGALWVHGDLHGARRVNEKWQAANLQAKLAAAARDRDIATALAAQVKSENAELETLNAALDKKVKDYAAQNSKRKDAACRLTRDDVGRLLDIWRSRSRR